MVWGLIRVVLFVGAFLAGMLLTPYKDHRRNPVPQVSQSAGASLVVACGGGKIVIGRAEVHPNAIKLHCLQSGMVVVPDARKPENLPAFNSTHAYIH
jgi:hypothetical protein